MNNNALHSVTGSRNCLVLGLAREGASLARFLAARGDMVTVTDSAPRESLPERATFFDETNIQFVLGGQHPELILAAEVLYVSPGIPETNPVYRAALKRNVPIRSMTTLFFELCPAPIIGITGSSGKTTTTGLIGHILREAGSDVVVGGNIGDPMLDLLPKVSTQTTVVLELSSFQLELLDKSPHVAVVTNISPNHLDRHGTMEEYIAAKRHIVEHQAASDYAILNAGDMSVRDYARSTPARLRWFGNDTHDTDGACVRNGEMGLVEQGRFSPVIGASQVPLLGQHNIENVLAACATTSIFGVSPQSMRCAIRSFRPPAHRLQTVGVHAGVQYVDDSIATTPERASVALRAISEPVILIAGGRDKHLPWDAFARLVVHRTRALFLIGEAADLIVEAVSQAMASTAGMLTSGAVRRCATLEEAVALAAAAARPGDVVLLSPACTSYDMFQDFAERGDAFVRAVEAVRAA